MPDKSIADSVGIDDKAFPLRKPPQRHLPKISQCPNCGAPIYGKMAVAREEDAEVRYTCACRVTKFEDQVMTK